MSGCNNAKFLSIRFEDVTKLKSIGNNFLKGNSELLERKLDKCTALEKIGSGFIEDCSRLIQFYAPYKNPSDMTVDEYGFMTNVTRSCEIHVGKDNVEAYKETYP